jgi:MerR family transcriptional regulator/heat shock protein HspR
MKSDKTKKSLEQSPANYPSDLPVYTIGIAAKLTKTSVHALRLYEERGLILPHKTKTHRRVYSQADIERLQCIRRHLDEEGLNIAGIKALLALVPCWLIKPCSPADREQCDAYTSTADPCWAVDQKGKVCQDVDCRACTVYLLGNRCHSIKQIWKEALKQAAAEGTVL